MSDKLDNSNPPAQKLDKSVNLYSTTPQLDSRLIAKPINCYCVCHSPTSSCGACEHCKGEYLRGAIDASNEQQTALIEKLIAEMPPKWETPERRTEPSNRQLGYNDAIDEVLAVLNKYRGEL